MNTPNAVSVALFAGETCLLIRRARPPLEGLWTLPGGRIEAGESAEAAAIREVREELGLAFSRPVLVGHHEADTDPPFRLAVFAAWIAHQDPVASPEIMDWRWVRPEDAAALATTPGLVAILLEARRLTRP